MRVLDLFCGRGGWSKPFIEDGDLVYGIDIKDYGYPGRLIKGDIREFDGYSFWDMDLIIGSPPCNEFSLVRSWDKAWPNRKQANPQEGLKLVREFERFVREAQPRFWAMENVDNMKKWYPAKPIWTFKISAGGKRRLWGNIPIPLAPDFRINRAFGNTPEVKKRWHMSRRLSSSERAEIPYPIARFIADIVKTEVSTYKPEANK